LEVVISMAIVTSILAFSIRSFDAYRPHVHQLGVLSKSTSAKIHMMEYRAVYGEWPPAAEVGGLEGHLEFTSQIRTGAVDFTFGTGQPKLVGQVLTVRAWQAFDRPELPVAWTCGHARATPLIAAGADLTTLQNADLVLPCRHHP
jgi:hypothetical protein